MANYLFKLMAYKDEYEVARLYLDPEFERRLREEFDGDFRVSVNLAPQLFNPRDPLSGRARKWEIPFRLARPAFRVLSAMRVLRGTAFDVFGKSAHRRAERARIEEYRSTIEGLLDRLDDGNYELATRVASIPETIRGYDSVKDRSVGLAEDAETELLREFAQASPAGVLTARAHE